MYDEQEYWSDEPEPELQMALRRSREEYEQSYRETSTTIVQASTSGSSGLASTSQLSSTRTQTSVSRQPDIAQRILDIEAEIAECEGYIARKQARRSTLQQELAELHTRISQSATSAAGKGKGRERTINYFERFERSDELLACARKTFGIEKFRLCQEGVCNANLDRRDIVCVMPTGGGKSLTYQLPAIMTPGCTIVVSPLISLMTDQVLHLEEFGVSAVMLSSALSRQEAESIKAQLRSIAYGQCSKEEEIKLCYVTPERLTADRHFKDLLKQLYEARKLARFVIDEAHCVSELGHDYRKDYKKLGDLRLIFPRVPILALSATCPPKVLQDISITLGLQYPPRPGTEADTHCTVYFSAPLYRKNLHYSVLPKPRNFADAINMTREFILDKHQNHSGIIYCLSKKDAVDVAHELSSESRGQIRTGVYHADIPDTQKVQLHKDWRDGKVNVVCATIAFGLGIDKADVRFVIHHSLPKSIEGLYQESGRAGRDGKSADCVVLYNPKDADRLSSLTASSRAHAKVFDVLRFVQDFEGCRKVFFAQYFSVSSELSVEEWTTEEKAALDRCGHCDNCIRAPESVRRVDLRLPAWQILKAAEAVEHCGSHLTMRQLVDIVRGLGHGKISVRRIRYKRAQESMTIDMTEIAGGKVELSPEETEILCIQLLINYYLKEYLRDNAHKTNTYLVPGPLADRFTRLTRADIVEAGAGPKLECVLPVNGKRKTVSKSAGKEVVRPAGAAPAKRRRSAAHDSLAQDDDGDAGAMVHEGVVVNNVTRKQPGRGGARNNTSNARRRQSMGRESPIIIEDSEKGDSDTAGDETYEGEPDVVDGDEGDVEGEDSSDDDWSYSLRDQRPPKRKRLQPYVEIPIRRARVVDEDVIFIDSD